MTYTYTYDNHHLSGLRTEIVDSDITIAFDYIEQTGTDLKIVFKAALPADDQTLLDNIVSTHDPSAYEDQVTKTVVQYDIEPYDPYDMHYIGAQFESVSGTTTNHDVKVDETNLELQSGELSQGIKLKSGLLKVLPSNTSVNENDYLEFEIVDLDNILGQGAGAILKHTHKKIYMWKERETKYMADGFHHLISGLYLRMIYHSQDGSPNTKFLIEYEFKKVV